MARLQTKLEAKHAEFKTEAVSIDRINRTLAKRDLEPLKLMTLEEWEAQQEGSEGSSSMAMAVGMGLLLAF